MVVRTLLAAARQRPGLDDRRCLLVLDLIQTGIAVRTALRRSLAEEGLSELKFALLVVLFAIDPEPATPADLADRIGVSRAAITEALDGLEKIALIGRTRDTADRRVIDVRLTPKGQGLADAALQRFLRTAGRVARFISLSELPSISDIGARLRSGATK